MQKIDKNELRKRLKELRKGLDTYEKSKMDMAIAQNLFSLKELLSAQKVLCYVSKQTEVDTENIISKLFVLNKTVAAPKMRDSDGNMDFYTITSLGETQKSGFGVREPIAEKCQRLIEFSNSVCILPALAFDKNGYRLGYGKGCYDRFLCSYSGLKIGICYESCIFDNLPKDKYDIAADIVVTEKRIIYIEKQRKRVNKVDEKNINELENHKPEVVIEEAVPAEENEHTVEQPVAEVAEKTAAEDIHRPKKKKKKKKSKLGILIRMLIIVAVSVLLSVFIIFGFKDIYGLDFSSAEKDVYIEKGSGTAQIADALYESGIIEQPLLFRVFCKLGNKTEGFQYGYHTFAENMSYDEIVLELKKNVKKDDVVEVTVIEGWNLYDIAKELKSKGVISDINAFTKAVERMEVSYDFISDVPDNKYRYYKYEGYFYPDKYEFYVGTDDYEGIAKKFFANFVNHLDSEIISAIEESEYTFDEIITIASLIQAEAGDVNQMGTVSSVFHNRLNSTLFPNLQSDVTINYVERAIKPSIAYEYQELYDAYNTYKRQGLMPGPICNPTKEAIRAALFPDKTNYYYFVTDNTGKYYYSTTYSQHLNNCNTAQKVNAKLEGN